MNKEKPRDGAKPYAPDEGGHWYDVQGNPHHFRENGKPTTLADARKNGWLPSVTKIIGDMMPKPALQTWKVNQALLAAFTLPRKVNEPDDQFIARVVEDMNAESEKARIIGKAHHKMMEDMLTMPRTIKPPTEQLLKMVPEELVPHIPTFWAWRLAYIDVVHWTETILVNANVGYAGTSDALVGFHPNAYPAIIDLKARKKSAAYQEDILQLAAYRLALGRNGVALVSVIVEKGSPEKVPLVKFWDEEEAKKAEVIFLKLVDLWQHLNDYFPGKAAARMLETIER